MTAEQTLAAGPRPSRLAIWIEATRPYSFTASVTPVLIGSVLAVIDGPFSFGRFLLALIGSLFIHIGANLINDYYDHLSGVDTLESMSGSQVIQRGLLTPGEMYWGGIATFGIGSVCGLLLVALCGWPILVLGIVSVLAGYFYTANPLPLAYKALGEATVFVFMGPVIVVGAYYVQREVFALAPFLISLPVGCLVASILHTNNIRDLNFDVAHGKHTLATMIGRQAANWELAILVYGAYVITVALIVLGYAPWTVAFTFLTLRHAIPAVRIAFTKDTVAELNEALMCTIKAHLEYGVLLILALLLNQMIS